MFTKTSTSRFSRRAVGRALAVAALIVMAGSAGRSSQHSGVVVPTLPTVDECRADSAAWASPELMKEYDYAEEKFLRDGTPNASQIAKLPLREITRRKQETTYCAGIDSERGHNGLGSGEGDYAAAHDWLAEIEADRMYHFIVRHNLLNKFRSEDEAGKR
jgi:hypothetical protein